MNDNKIPCKQVSMTKLEAINDGWLPQEAESGYCVATSFKFGNGATHIERIKAMDVFASDWEAAAQAEKDGIKIIRDLMLPREHQAPYIDTPENRMLLADLVISDTKEAHNLSENEYHAFLDAEKVVCKVCLKSSEENCAACPVQYTCSRLEKIMEDNYLYDADPDCRHEIVPASGGGVICKKCRGWYCF